MYRQLFIILFLCCLFSSSRLQAQTTEEKSAQSAISIEPHYLMNGGLGLNLETKICPNHWIELNLTGFHLSHSDRKFSDYYFWSWYGGGHAIPNSDFDYISGLSGLGIGATYKYYFFRNFRVNTALSYNWYNVGYEGYEFYPYTEDGLTFYDYKWANIHQPFHKLRLHVALGVRSTFERVFFAEPYVGIGYTYSFYDENKRAYDETVFGYGHRGLYVLAGIKLGFNLHKK